MPSMSVLNLAVLASLTSLASTHSQILSVQGIAGSPASVGFQVENLARNCTSISPCQQDATLIRDAEITSNVANECGRTEISGNIDVGENTEDALAAGQVTQVKAGTQLTVTIHQVNADGAGPYTCDMDPTGNTLGATGQIPLTVTNNVPGSNGFSQAKTQDFNMTVTLPTDLACTGGSTGNICTVRCRNNALAGPFGGCVAVQQVDTETKTNIAAEITTASTKAEIESQVQQDQKDLPDAIAANQAAGTDEQIAAANKVAQMVQASIVSSAQVVQTPAADASNTQATGTAPEKSSTDTNDGGKKKSSKGGNAD
ncbi:unnamed protein product [Discula destructiva]